MLLGYTNQEIYRGGNHLWLSKIHAADFGRAHQAYTALFEQGSVYDEEYRVQRKDGAWIWAHDRASGTHEENGVLYADGFVCDITARKQAEEELRSKTAFLVLSVHVFSQFDGKPRIRASLTALWEHSVTVSSLAQRIASCEGCAKAMVEQSFTAGLLHDIGKVVLLAEMPREYHEIFEAQPGTSQTLERERLGCTHAEVGAYLMSIWGLPFSLVHAVAFHHHSSESTETEFSCLTAVHAANAIVRSTDATPSNPDGEIDTNYLDHLGLREKEAVWRGLHQPAMSLPGAPAGKHP